MSSQAVRRLGVASFALTVALLVGGEVLNALAPRPTLSEFFRFYPVAFAFAVVGALLVARRPDNCIAWLVSAIGFLYAIYDISYSFAAFDRSASWAVALDRWGWFPSEMLTVGVLPLVFPTGKLQSARWRPVLWLATAGIVAAVVVGFSGWNPSAQTASADGLLAALFGFAQLSFLVCLILALGSVVVRYRRAESQERQQLKWFVDAVLLVILFLVGAQIVGRVVFHVSPFDVPVADGLIHLSFVAIPVAIGIAILKYRLYDIDVVINKTLLFGAMAAFITLVYVAIVVGIGNLVGTGGKPNLALSIVATALVAIAFEPVRERVQRVANRLVYGKRATPYEVLSQFSERVADVYSSEDVLPQMASVLGEGTGASRADVWIRLGDTIAPTASWPIGDGPPPAPVDVSGQLPASVPGVSRIVPVRHQGELLGAVSVNKRPGETLTPVEEKLLADLAAQAGLVLRNVHLTTELQIQLTEISRQAVELRASRQRIVATQDAERRRLERNIHDGAQQNLVALTVKLRLATNLAKRDPERARDSVKALEDESDQALATLRALARGIYPPLLQEQGLVAAVRADAEKMAVPSDVTADDIDRYSPDVEAAVYFVCLEALQNVTKHAKASHVQITLHSRQTALSFDIADDGTGFDVTKDSKGSGLRNMSDRIDAMGGRLEIRSAPQGTTVSGVVPIRAMEPVG
jgi:signal transduction histidine kinase